MGCERVLKLAGHHGRPTNCVRWVTSAQFFVCESESIFAASLGEETAKKIVEKVSRADSAT